MYELLARKLVLSNVIMVGTEEDKSKDVHPDRYGIDYVQLVSSKHMGLEMT